MSKTEIPSIRFHGFDDAWEQRKAKELFVSTADKGYPELPVLSATQDRGMIRRDENSINIFHDKKNEAGYKRVLPGQFVIHLRSFQGGFAHSAIEGITSPAYTVFGFSDPEKHDSEYWKYVFTSKAFIRRLETVTYGIRDGRSISYDEFLTLSFVYPSRSEQTAIAQYLDKLSNLITLHQRKLEKLTNVKKSMLEKMFPQNGSSYPEIRFKGFTDAWEQRKFGEVFMSLQNNTLSRAELNDEFGAAQNIHYGDVLIKYDEILDVSKEPLSYIEKQSIADKFKTSYLQNGDVIIADTAEDETVGKCTEIEGLTDQKVISGLHTIPVRPNRKFASGFLGFYLNSAAYHDQLKPLMQGIKVTSISKGAMQDTVVKFPLDLKEQEQIGIYFGGLDHLITLHQRELEKLQSVKKAMLEKMFV